MSFRLIFSILLLFSFHNVLNSQSSFSAKLSIPSEIVQTESVTVTLNIYKPKGIRSYATFTQKLPAGFYVKAINLSGATLSYEENELILTWLRISEEEKVTVTYELSPMVGISGSYDVSGSLSYLIGNKQGKFELKKYKVTVLKEKKDVAKIDNTVDYNHTLQIKRNTLKDISCSRTITYNKRKNEYDVEVKIIKKTIDSYNIVEKLPKNFAFEETESLDADVFINKSLVQYYWRKAPTSKEIIVKYKLKPNKDQKDKPIIVGKLSFLSEGQIINTTIFTKD